MNREELEDSIYDPEEVRLGQPLVANAEEFLDGLADLADGFTFALEPEAVPGVVATEQQMARMLRICHLMKGGDFTEVAEMADLCLSVIEQDRAYWASPDVSEVGPQDPEWTLFQAAPYLAKFVPGSTRVFALRPKDGRSSVDLATCEDMTAYITLGSTRVQRYVARDDSGAVTAAAWSFPAEEHDLADTFEHRWVRGGTRLLTSDDPHAR